MCVRVCETREPASGFPLRFLFCSNACNSHLIRHGDSLFRSFSAQAHTQQQPCHWMITNKQNWRTSVERFQNFSFFIFFIAFCISGEKTGAAECVACVLVASIRGLNHIGRTSCVFRVVTSLSPSFAVSHIRAYYTLSHLSCWVRRHHSHFLLYTSPAHIHTHTHLSALSLISQPSH